MCSGRVKSECFKYRNTGHTKKTHQRLLELAHASRALVVLRVGFDDEYDHSKAQREI